VRSAARRVTAAGCASARGQGKRQQQHERTSGDETRGRGADAYGRQPGTARCERQAPGPRPIGTGRQEQHSSRPGNERADLQRHRKTEQKGDEHAVPPAVPASGHVGRDEIHGGEAEREGIDLGFGRALPDSTHRACHHPAGHHRPPAGPPEKHRGQRPARHGGGDGGCEVHGGGQRQEA
jgi:hypothetical protein